MSYSRKPDITIHDMFTTFTAVKLQGVIGQVGQHKQWLEESEAQPVRDLAYLTPVVINLIKYMRKSKRNISNKIMP
jgi:hypothetical protein